jgi:hypothetical protein
VSFWILLQVLLDIVLFAGVVGLWIRLNRPQKDDPRLSKGLQLLQSKIAVLEDLSDRTETQVNQLTALLEQKVKDVQAKIQASEKAVGRIDQSMQKSLEVAKIFQDRIPHTEILERQNTIKYVKAARLAHQGLSVDEIATQVDLSVGEIEFIAKVNRDQLMFCEDSLPEWANDEAIQNAELEPSLSNVDDMTFMAPLPKESATDISTAFDLPKTDQQALKKLGDAFKAACQEVKEKEEAAVAAAQTPSIFSVTQDIAQNFLGENPFTPRKKDNIVRPVEFRRIDMTKDLG